MSDSDSDTQSAEVMAGEGSSLAPPSEPSAHTRRLRVKSKVARIETSLPAGAAPEQTPVDALDTAAPTCFLCEIPGSLTHKYRSHPVHGECKAAIRSYLWIKDDIAKNHNFDIDYFKNPMGWREKIFRCAPKAAAAHLDSAPWLATPSRTTLGASALTTSTKST